jgi:hypothetical protein
VVDDLDDTAGTQSCLDSPLPIGAFIIIELRGATIAFVAFVLPLVAALVRGVAVKLAKQLVNQIVKSNGYEVVSIGFATIV